MQAALPLPRIVPLLNDSHVFCVGIRLSSSLYSLPLPLSCRQNLCLSVSSGVSSYLLPHLCHAPNCCTGGSNIPLSAFFLIRHFCYLSFVPVLSPYTTKSRKLFYKSAAYAFTYLQHFLQAVYFFFAWLSGMLFGFFIPEQLGLLWYFLLLRSTYTVVSPVCWLTLGVASSITSSSILHPNVCTPPQKFPVFLRCSGLSGTFSLSPPPALPID